MVRHLLAVSLFGTALLSTSVSASSPQLVTPAQLQQQLQTDSARRFQQQRDQPQDASASALPITLLDALRTDTGLSPAARDWLLHDLVMRLRQQRASADWQRALHTLTDYPDHFFLEQDFEGRSRALALAPVAQAARGTLQLWQRQQQAADIQATLTPELLQQRIQFWSTTPAAERQAWLLAIDTLPDASLARLGDPEPIASAKAAAALAATVALRRQDVALAHAVLSHGNATDASRLQQQLGNRFTVAEQLQLQRAAQQQPALRSQSWFAIATLADANAGQLLQQAARRGDRAALAAWVQKDGEQLLPELRQWLGSDRETQQLNAIYALRLLATPAAMQTLKVASKQHRVSARVQQELQP